jgi:hypothetical protein
MYKGGVNTINLLLDPSVSLQALGALRKLAERAQTGEISVQDAKREAQRIHPKAGRLFDVADWPGQAKATLYGAIICAVGAVAAAKIATAPSQTTVINPSAFERVIQDAAKSPAKVLHRGKGLRLKQRQKKKKG